MFCNFEGNPDSNGFWDKIKNVKDVEDNKYILYQKKDNDGKSKYWLVFFEFVKNPQVFTLHLKRNFILIKIMEVILNQY